MRLFLSSENLGNHPDAFLRMVEPGRRVGLIENAKDDWSEDDRAAKVKQHMDQFAEQGFKPTDIDLREYFGQSEELRKIIETLDGVFVHGGNTFILRRAMAASGLDKILKELVPAGRPAYGGSSAGSCIAAPTLHGIERGDRPSPEAVPDSYPVKEVIWDGLNFVPFMVVPHYTSEWFRQDALVTEKSLNSQNIPYRILEDGQVIVVNDEKEELLP